MAAQRASSNGKDLPQLSIGKSLRHAAQNLQVAGARRLFRRGRSRRALHGCKVLPDFSSQIGVDDQPSGADHPNGATQPAGVRSRQVSACAHPQESVRGARGGVLLHHQNTDGWELSADPRHRRQAGTGPSDREYHGVQSFEQLQLEPLVKLVVSHNLDLQAAFRAAKRSCERS